MKYRIFLSLILLVSSRMMAQQKDSTDLMNLLNKETKNEQATKYTTATFKTTRIINGMSIENDGPGVVDVKFSHRFYTVKDGWETFFGLKNADTRIGIDYGINKWLMTGIGWTSVYNTVDGFFKAKLLRQSKGEKNMPISLSAVAIMQVNTVTYPREGADSAKNVTKSEFNNRVSYTAQLLIARKFSEGFSLQLSPTWIHYNMVPDPPGLNPPLTPDYAHQNLLSVGIGGRQKVSKRSSITFEYFYQIPDHKIGWSVNAFSVGYEIETGGHVFQLILTNSNRIDENHFIPLTYDKWSDGNFHIGFNISRVFTVAHKNEVQTMK